MTLVYVKPALAHETKIFFSVSLIGNVTLLPGYVWLCHVKNSPRESTITLPREENMWE